MGDLLNDWNSLDIEHKRFILRVDKSRGGKHGAEPCSIGSDVRYDPPNEECFKSIALWVKAEKSGFIECVGSYKWVTTDKYADLEKELFLNEYGG